MVEDEKTGSQLLSKGQLRKRVTLIPLNKISAFVASAAKVGAAQKIAPGKVDLALSLVGFEDDVAKAMEYVFGNTLICADAATAKRVTFDAAVKLKSVTLEGDVYDPAGTLSGGSKPSTGGILVKAQELRRLQKELDAARKHLKACEAELQEEEAKSKKMSGMTRDLQLKTHEVALLEEQVLGSTASRLATEIKTASESIGELEGKIRDATERHAKAKEEIKFFEHEMEEFGADKEAKLNTLRDTIKKRKAAIQKVSAGMKTRQNQVRTLVLELEQSETEIELARADLEKQRTQAGAAKADLEQHKARVAAMQVSLLAFAW